MQYRENEEKDQLRTDLGNTLLPQNQKVYENLIPQVTSKEVLEAGCGNGAGSYLLAQSASYLHATDKLYENILFAESINHSKGNLTFGVWDIGEKPWWAKHEVVVAIEVIEHVKKYRQAIQNLIQSAIHSVWISTPNRDGLDNKWIPQQEFHVKEFTVQEMLDMIGGHEIEIYHWETFEKLLHIPTTKGQNIPLIKVHPLVYHIKL